MGPEPGDRALARAAAIAIDYLQRMPDLPVREESSLEELRAAIRVPLNDAPLDPELVVDELVVAAEPGLVQIQSPRYFGFVIGGGLEAAIAADWLTSAWDQNAGGYPCGPSAAVVEEAVAEWLLDLLGLPASAGVGLTTGCQMAHFSCLAAARNHELAETGWNVECDGLFGAPPLRVIAGAHAHTTVFAALRMLGMGSNRTEIVETDDQGRMLPGALARTLRGGEGPAIVVAQAGDVNTGAVDPFAQIADIVHDYGAWLHVDGAFGLWAAASPRLRPLVAGVENAHSWATDAHKWLNVPYDCGVAIVRDADTQRAALSSIAGAEYIPPAEHGERYNAEWVPEFSRRARGFPVYAAIRSLGRQGVAELVERCCACARLMAATLSELDGAEVLNEVALNQVLVRFTRDGANVSEEVLRAIQDDGTCWMSGSTWDGEPVVRISVSNWRTTEDDVRRSAEAIERCLRQPLARFADSTSTSDS
ncbi:MAG TPA: aminotransferase class V-fold PLP-dependent enzyme [Thermoleophilaceae bacterium]|jgi:glutamate/tyrosine decarboxylase-like PLP-dependent enzyme|nr:aminotransferase class V-fold PLP-dependent enzyme [Thermoleophilaceae bacterium]